MHAEVQCGISTAKVDEDPPKWCLRHANISFIELHSLQRRSLRLRTTEYPALEEQAFRSYNALPAASLAYLLPYVSIQLIFFNIYVKIRIDRYSQHSEQNASSCLALV